MGHAVRQDAQRACKALGRPGAAALVGDSRRTPRTADRHPAALAAALQSLHAGLVRCRDAAARPLSQSALLLHGQGRCRRRAGCMEQRRHEIYTDRLARNVRPQRTSRRARCGLCRRAPDRDIDAPCRCGNGRDHAARRTRDTLRHPHRIRMQPPVQTHGRPAGRNVSSRPRLLSCRRRHLRQHVAERPAPPPTAASARATASATTTILLRDISASASWPYGAAGVRSCMPRPSCRV